MAKLICIVVYLYTIQLIFPILLEKILFGNCILQDILFFCNSSAMRQKYIKITWEFIHKVIFCIFLAYSALPKRGNDVLTVFSSFMAELLHFLVCSAKHVICHMLTVTLFLYTICYMRGYCLSSR